MVRCTNPTKVRWNLSVNLTVINTVADLGCWHVTRTGTSWFVLSGGRSQPAPLELSISRHHLRSSIPTYSLVGLRVIRKIKIMPASAMTVRNSYHFEVCRSDPQIARLSARCLTLSTERLQKDRAIRIGQEACVVGLRLRTSKLARPRGCSRILTALGFLELRLIE